MNRIEIIGFFAGLERCFEQKDYEGAEKIVREILQEARSKDNKKEKED